MYVILLVPIYISAWSGIFKSNVKKIVFILVYKVVYLALYTEFRYMKNNIIVIRSLFIN